MYFEGPIADSYEKPEHTVRKRIATLTSNIFNPFLIGIALMLLALLASTPSWADALKWLLLLTCINVLPITLFMVYLVRRDRLESLFANVRRQRTRIYAMATFLFGVSCILLLFLDAPLILLAMFVTTFSANVVFMCVNLRWKVSLHAAFGTSAVVVLLILYGFKSAAFLSSVALIPLIAWARIELERHSLPQVIIGALLASSILVAVFYLFGLI